jgi:hypothetical protein
MLTISSEILTRFVALLEKREFHPYGMAITKMAPVPPELLRKAPPCGGIFE